MKKLIFILAISLISSIMMVNATNIFVDPVSDPSYVSVQQGDRVVSTGSMLLKGDIWVIRAYDDDGIVDYVPLNLPQQFMVAGLYVKFAGTIKQVSDTGKLAGVPIYLIQIKALPIR